MYIARQVWPSRIPGFSMHQKCRSNLRWGVSECELLRSLHLACRLLASVLQSLCACGGLGQRPIDQCTPWSSHIKSCYRTLSHIIAYYRALSRVIAGDNGVIVPLSRPFCAAGELTVSTLCATGEKFLCYMYNACYRTLSHGIARYRALSRHDNTT